MKSPIISKFFGEYAFLSNFYPSPVEFEGITYPTVEHAFQAAKSLNPEDRLRISQAPTPGQAKRHGRTVTLRPQWDEMRIAVMHELVYQKFSKDRVLKKRLLKTGQATLIEGNNWNDTFWGVCNGEGENHLGRILMGVRRVLELDSFGGEVYEPLDKS